MKTLFNCALIVFLFVITAYAQDVEYGKPSELKGLTKVYIEAMGNVADAERMTERITKAKVPGLVIVEDVKQAEIILVFGGAGVSRDSGLTMNQIGNTVYADTNREMLFAGEGRVFISGADGKKARLILRVQNEQETKLEKRPVTKFTNEFLKIYKKANDIK